MICHFPRPASLAGIALAAVRAGGPAAADDIEDALTAALEAYRAGDLALAQEETAFAAQLLAQQKAEELSAFLPEPLAGWTADEIDTEATGAMAAMFGGGQVASRVYYAGDTDVDITIMADNPMVATMGAMFSNPAMMAAAGRMKRIGGQKAVLNEDGELMALIAGRFLVQISGSAGEAEKTAYFEAIDFDGLKAF
ncbi:MAG: hypothetical protein AAF899_08145 [Pseudomonadota bacterium]